MRVEHTAGQGTEYADAMTLAPTGNLADVSLLEILRCLYRRQATGMVRIGACLDGPVMFFKQGELYRCEWGTQQGSRALAAALAMEGGAYLVILRPTPEPHRNIHQDTGALLNEVTRRRAQAGDPSARERAPGGPQSECPAVEAFAVAS